MKQLYIKYRDVLVGLLMTLLCFKSCQSCSRDRIIEFQSIKNEVLVDSLKRDINVLNSQKDSMTSDIQLYISNIQSLNNTIDIYKEEIQDLKADNKHYRNTNRVLINTNNQIINKELE